MLPLVAGHVSYVAGRGASSPLGGGAVAMRLPAIGLSLCFVLGFSTVFVILGATATALGQLLLGYRYQLNLVGGATVILFGLFVIGLMRPSWMSREARFHLDIPGGRAASAYVLGLAFAFGRTPCIDPILWAILTVSAASATVKMASCCSLSIRSAWPSPSCSRPSSRMLLPRLKAIGRAGRLLQLIAGAIMVVMGVAMITGSMSDFSFWMLEHVPILARMADTEEILMARKSNLRGWINRRGFVVGTAGLVLQTGATARGNAAEAATLDRRFNYLNTHSNSNCSAAFMDSIATMPVSMRLQGSCCAPMDRHRYVEQVRALRKYRDIPEIPPDPYDIPAGMAQSAMSYYDLAVSPGEQQTYDYAMENSDEKGPCCCACWRWNVYGGLAKQLIRERRFTGKQVVELWNLSNGCGGGAEHRHG